MVQLIPGCPGSSDDEFWGRPYWSKLKVDLSKFGGSKKSKHFSIFNSPAFYCYTHTFYGLIDKYAKNYMYQGLVTKLEVHGLHDRITILKYYYFRDGDGFVQFSEIESYYRTELIDRVGGIKKATKSGFLTIIDFMVEVRVS